ncbi:MULTISPECIES: hypothetical protein [unclassified Mesorhizobium]|nr:MULTISPECIES: hypothetical protein [unclassified Mesorhizobium]
MTAITDRVGIGRRAAYMGIRSQRPTGQCKAIPRPVRALRPD